jgi:hypothetical protein
MARRRGPAGRVGVAGGWKKSEHLGLTFGVALRGAPARSPSAVRRDGHRDRVGSDRPVGFSGRPLCAPLAWSDRPAPVVGNLPRRELRPRGRGRRGRRGRLERPRRAVRSGQARQSSTVCASSSARNCGGHLFASGALYLHLLGVFVLCVW